MRDYQKIKIEIFIIALNENVDFSVKLNHPIIRMYWIYNYVDNFKLYSEINQNS